MEPVMLLAADKSQDDLDFEMPPSTAASATAPRIDLAFTPAYGSRYGEGRQINVWAISLAVVIHIVLLAAILLVRSEGVVAKRDKLTVVDLSSPPPPPAATAAPQQKTPPPVAAPPPLITIPRPTPPITTSPVIELQPVPVSVNVAPAPAPVVSTASAAVAAPTPSIVESSGLDTKMISGAPPRYPVQSRREREQGTVVLALILGTDGAVSSISVAKSSGFDRLDDAALRAVRKWRWAPTMRNGQAVMVRGQVEIPFVLQG